MNRFHVHLNVTDLDTSVRFYSQLFAAEPTVLKPDYAKWMLEDPRVNFAISNTGRAAGIDHLGIQAGSDVELTELGRRLDAAGGAVVPEDATICCYRSPTSYGPKIRRARVGRLSIPMARPLRTTRARVHVRLMARPARRRCRQ